ncbi:hypothetical protein [Chengkuizengella axinellae]|uniref:DNA-binding protein n=1 Tax=Chengkuizengella axinellae TaxID=3064388 RepID=A0ABT9J2K7_9BACL|nr:hypothetical protein [Chengkuizengella sp. 2205SS18-9]MDP5275249.1 hypothetical protein [Chengkuizengella sp. 2205SS18-9]
MKKTIIKMTERKQLITLLKRSIDIPLKRVVAIRAPYWDALINNLPKVFEMEEKTLVLDHRITVRYIMQIPFSQLKVELDQTRLNKLIELLEKVVVIPPRSYNKNSYYTVKEMSDSLSSTEESIIERLEKGEFKGAFIDKKGQWLIPK